MKITIICVGKIGPTYLKKGIEEFMKRLQSYCSLNIIEIKESKFKDSISEKDKEKALEKEGENILKNVKDTQYMVLLDLKGKNISSEQLAEKIEYLAITGKSDLVFVIGGAFGNAEALRKRANMNLSFGAMTYTHQMIRILLLEQIYRSFKIIKNEPYHW